MDRKASKLSVPFTGPENPTTPTKNSVDISNFIWKNQNIDFA